MPSRVSRSRRFLALVALMLLALLVLAGCPGNQQEEETPPGSTTSSEETPAPQSTINTRVEISSFTPDQIDALRKGIALMKQRQSTDPTSWIYQANIHGVPGQGANCPASTDPMQEAWATCQHGSFFFLAWHRMYLFYFERILRDAIQEATGDPNYQFALPYWDYANGSPQLPQPFTTPADASNSLYVAQRRTVCNSPQAGLECVSAVQGSSTQAMATVPTCNCPSGQASCDGCTPGLNPDETFFGQFTPQPEHFLGQFGELELQPHNVIHNRVGSFSGWMSDPDCAARDPIFWLHHANIDRLWQVWLNQNAGRENPLASTAWKTQKFTFFDADKTKVEKTGCEILNMISQLDYQYQDLPVNNVVLCDETPEPQADQAPPAAPAPPTVLAESAPRGTTLGSEPVKVAVPVPAAARQRVRSLAASTEPERLRLVVEGLSLLDNGAVYEVYLNLPQGQQPDPKGPYFVGHLSLFGHAGHDRASSRTFDITDEMHELQQRGEWKDRVELTFVLSGRTEAQATAEAIPGQLLRFQKVSVVTRQR